MSFGQPLWFWALALLPALVGLFIHNGRRRAILLRQLVAARLHERLAGSVSTVKRRWRFALLLIGLACVIASLTQPRFGYTWEQSKRKGRDVLIAIDCSRSMLSADLAPDRLGRARLAAQDLIGQLEGDRVGLIAFAGTAFLQAPLTVDYGAVLSSLAELDPSIIPRGGTDIAAAIKTAAEAFGKGESENRCLVLFTDGEELDEDGIKAAEAQNGTIRIFTVGVGSAEGSLIPVRGANGGTEFVKDENGQFVKSRLDEDRLRKIAEVTGGFYIHLQNGPAEMTQIVRDGLGKMKEKEIDVKMSRRPIERYRWPLSAGLATLAGAMLIGERKRGPIPRAASASAAGLGLALLALSIPNVARAKNSGLEAYERKDYSGAQQQFSNQLQRLPDSQALEFDLGAASYKAGDYGKALEAFAKAVTSPDQQLRTAAEYNLGNTLYQRGAERKDKEPKIREWKNALQHYDQALKAEPQNKDAKFNRDLVQRLIDELEKEQPEQQPQEKKDDKKDEKDQKQDQQQKGKKDEKKDGSGKERQQDQSQNQEGAQQQQTKNEKDGQSRKSDEGKPKDQKDPGNSSEQNRNQGSEPKSGHDQPRKDQNGGDQAKNDSPRPEGDAERQPPAPENQGEKKASGEIQAQPSQDKDDSHRQEAEEAAAAKEGKMTELQARELLDSLKGEDQRVQLLKPNERKNHGRVFRDW